MCSPRGGLRVRDEPPALLRAAGVDITVRCQQMHVLRPFEHPIEPLARKLGMNDTVVVARDIVESDNTSAASIPLAELWQLKWSNKFKPTTITIPGA